MWPITAISTLTLTETEGPPLARSKIAFVNLLALSGSISNLYCYLFPNFRIFSSKRASDGGSYTLFNKKRFYKKLVLGQPNG